MTNNLSNSKTPQECIQKQKGYTEHLKNKYFESLMTGLNEAVAIEKGELIGKETTLEIQS